MSFEVLARSATVAHREAVTAQALIWLATVWPTGVFASTFVVFGVGAWIVRSNSTE